jgi:hypothetical protein
VEEALAGTISINRNQLHMIRRAGRVMFFCAVTATALPLGAAPPQIAQLSPLALAPGKTTDITIHGQHLLNPRSLWTTFAARCEFQPAEDESAQKGEKLVCKVTVPREEQVGIGALRVVTAEGVSNPVLVMLDDLPTVAETSDNHAIEQAQPIQPPIAIDGQCDAVQEDLYRFHAVAGQRMSFEIVSQRLGSKLDPLVRIVTLDGAEIVRLDDTEGTGGDTRFVHTFASEGDYLLAVRDVRYAGGGEYRYRLRIGSFPMVTSVYPAGGRSGAVMSFELLGHGDDLVSPLNVTIPKVEHRARLVSFSIPSSEQAGSGWFHVEANSASESLEQEPNDSAGEATPADFPGAINGRLDKPGDRDYFKFRANKGQRVTCVARTRELGSACDLYMSLHKADGSQIAVARQDRQTILNATVPEDGDYVLQVEDLLVGNAAGCVYRIDMSEQYRGFGIHAEQTQYSAPQGGTFVVKVLAERRGYNGPIELSVEGLGEGAKLEGNKLEGGETLLKITMPDDIAAGEMRLASIVGKATVDGANVSVRANQRDPLAAMFPNALSLPTELEETLAIGVGPPFPPFFELSVVGSQVYFPQLVGSSSFEININRTNEAFKDPVTIAVEGLPAGIQAEVAAVDDGMKAYRVTLKGPVDLAEQDVPIRISGWGKFQEQARKVVLENVSLRVTKPLVVSVAMSGPIVAGNRGEAHVQLQRFGDEPQSVRLQVTDGPAGVSAPIFVTVPSDKNEVKIPLSAEPTAPAGRFDNLVVVASTTVKGQNVTVASNPASVEIVPQATQQPEK